MSPFIYPIIAKMLVLSNIIQDIEQLEKSIEIFKGFHWIFLVIIALGMISIFDLNIKDGCISFLSNIKDFTLKGKEHEIQMTMSNPKELDKETVQTAKEIREVAKDILVKKEKIKRKDFCKECNIEEVKEERESLRYFSAYQVTNKFSRELLKIIKENDKIKVEIFIDNMYMYYQSSIRNMGKKRKEEFITNKIEELLAKLKYLNIIEYTEDDNFIILTQNGKEFVNGYCKNEEVG